MPQRLSSYIRLLMTTGLFLVSGTALVKADLITEWTQQALAGARFSNDYSPEVSRNLAMMHAAVYNAVEGISGQYELYQHGSYSGPSGTAASGASMEAAAATAAWRVVQQLYPSMGSVYDDLYSTQIGNLADNQARTDGINYGLLVANDILNWRSADGAADANNPPYSPLGSVGFWDQTAPGYQTAALPGWGNVATFGVASASTYAGSLGATNSAYLTTSEYAQQYNTVKDLGGSTSTTRTTDQTNAAYFWRGGVGTNTNVGLWNDVAGKIVTTQNLSLQDSARLYAALNIAMADANIVAWQTKYEIGFWSPITAINNGAADSNPLTAGDVNWQPLINSPNYPAYFAEQGALGGAAAGILSSFISPSFSFNLGSDTNGDGIADQYADYTISSALQDAIWSGVWAGNYMSKAGTDAATAGGQVASAVLGSQFAVVPEPSGALFLLLSAVPWLMRRRRSRAV